MEQAVIEHQEHMEKILNEERARKLEEELDAIPSINEERDEIREGANKIMKVWACKKGREFFIPNHPDVIKKYEERGYDVKT
jgi:hypothetical protein